MALSRTNLLDLATLSGGNWQSTLPRANLQLRELYKIARSATAANADTKFTATFANPVTAQHFALGRTNMTPGGALVRLTVLDPADDVTVLFQSAWQAVSAESRARYNVDWIYAHTTALTSRIWTFEIDDDSNAAGFVDVARGWLGPTFQPSINYDVAGNGLGVVDPTIVEEAIGGAEDADERPRRRTFRFLLDRQEEDVGMDLYDMILEKGIWGEWLIDPKPIGSSHRYKFAMIGRLRELSDLEEPYTDRNLRVPMSAIELL